MNEIVASLTYFGFAVSLVAYLIGVKIHQRFPYPFFNPLLIAAVSVILLLKILGIEYEAYDQGARYITYFLTPATVCLALPLYRQIEVLKKYKGAILISITAGCIMHAVVIMGLGILTKLDPVLIRSTLPKSVTTAIALGISQEIGGISGITVIGVTVAGMLGAVAGPTLLRIFKIVEPVAQGLAIGTASHALGTSKAVELGQVQGAMSSLAIVVTGILTVVLVPLVTSFLK